MKKVVYGYGADTNELNATKDLLKGKNSVINKLYEFRFKQDDNIKDEANHQIGTSSDSYDLKEISQLDTIVNKHETSSIKKHNLDEDFDKDFTNDNNNQYNDIKKTSSVNLNDLMINDSDSENQSTNLDKKEFDQAFNNVNFNTEINSNSDLDNALDVVQDNSVSLLKVDPNFTSHDEVAQRINSKLDMGWHATS